MAKDPKAQPFVVNANQPKVSNRPSYEEATAAHPSSAFPVEAEEPSLPYAETSAFEASAKRSPPPQDRQNLILGAFDETAGIPMLTEKNQIPPRVSVPRPKESPVPRGAADPYAASSASSQDPYAASNPYAASSASPQDPYAAQDPYAPHDPYAAQEALGGQGAPGKEGTKKPRVKRPKPQSALKTEDDKPKKPQTLPLPLLFVLVLVVITVFVILFLRRPSLEDELKMDQTAADLPERLIKASRWRDAADVYKQRSQNREALVLYEQNQAWQDAAALLHQMKQYKAAGTYYEKADMYEAAAHAFEEAKMFLKAGALYRRARRFDKALANFAAAKAWLQIAQIHEDQKQGTKAAEFYEKAGIAVKAADFYFREKNYEKAFALYSKLEAHSHAAQAALYLDRMEEALQLFTKAKLDRCIGGIHHASSRHGSAAQIFLQIADKQADYALLLLAARSAEQAQKFKVAKAALKAALNTAERFEQVSRIGEVKEMQGNRREAFQILFSKASKFLQKGEPWQAERHLRPLAQMDELSLGQQTSLRKLQDSTAKALQGLPRLVETQRKRASPLVRQEEKTEHSITIHATVEAPAGKIPPKLRLFCVLFQQDLSPYILDEVDNTEELTPIQACRFFRGAWKNFLTLEAAPAGVFVESPLPDLTPGEKTTMSFSPTIPAPYRHMDCVLRPAEAKTP